MKPGTRIEFTYAFGRVVPGRIISVETSPRWLGWYVAELADEGGSYRGCIHGDQVRVVDNRA